MAIEVSPLLAMPATEDNWMILNPLNDALDTDTSNKYEVLTMVAHPNEQRPEPDTLRPLRDMDADLSKCILHGRIGASFVLLQAKFRFRFNSDVKLGLYLASAVYDYIVGQEIDDLVDWKMPVPDYLDVAVEVHKLQQRELQHRRRVEAQMKAQANAEKLVKEIDPKLN